MNIKSFDIQTKAQRGKNNIPPIFARRDFTTIYSLEKSAGIAYIDWGYACLLF